MRYRFVAGVLALATCFAGGAIALAGTAAADEPGSDYDASSIVITSGEDPHLVDSVTAGPLAAAQDTSVLTTPTATLGTDAQQYLASEKPDVIYLVGGAAAITPATALSIAAADPGAHLYRLSGQTRYGTALAVARAIDAMNAHWASGTATATAK